MWNLNAVKLLRMQKSHPNNMLPTISFPLFFIKYVLFFFHIFSLLNQSINAESKNFLKTLNFHGNTSRDQTQDFQFPAKFIQQKRPG